MEQATSSIVALTKGAAALGDERGTTLKFGTKVGIKGITSFLEGGGTRRMPRVVRVINIDGMDHLRNGQR